MRKKDVMKYLSNNDKERNGAHKKLTAILECSSALVSIWDDDALIPAYRAMELDVFFRVEANRIKYDLADDHPVFSMYDYIDPEGKVHKFRTPSLLKGSYEAGLGGEAARVLEKADKTDVFARKISIMKKFIKGLI